MDIFSYVLKIHNVDLHAVFPLLEQFYASIDARNAHNTQGLNLPCRSGCSHCCHECVFLTPLEFFYVWNFVQTHFSKSDQETILLHGLALYGQYKDIIEACNVPPTDPEKGHFEIVQNMRFACPFLSTAGACRVYPVRELYARLFGCSFEKPGVVYGCHMVEGILAGQTVRLLSTQAVKSQFRALPLTHMRQVYPYFMREIAQHQHSA